MGTDDGLRSGYFSYNQSLVYVAQVFGQAHGYTGLVRGHFARRTRGGAGLVGQRHATGQGQQQCADASADAENVPQTAQPTTRLSPSWHRSILPQ